MLDNKKQWWKSIENMEKITFGFFFQLNRLRPYCDMIFLADGIKFVLSFYQGFLQDLECFFHSMIKDAQVEILQKHRVLKII